MDPVQQRVYWQMQALKNKNNKNSDELIIKEQNLSFRDQIKDYREKMKK